VEKNAETYRRQVYKVLDPGRTEIRFNSEWFQGMSFSEAIEKLASRWTIRFIGSPGRARSFFRWGSVSSAA